MRCRRLLYCFVILFFSSGAQARPLVFGLKGETAYLKLKSEDAQLMQRNIFLQESGRLETRSGGGIFIFIPNYGVLVLESRSRLDYDVSKGCQLQLLSGAMRLIMHEKKAPCSVSVPHFSSVIKTQHPFDASFSYLAFDQRVAIDLFRGSVELIGKLYRGPGKSVSVGVSLARPLEGTKYFRGFAYWRQLEAESEITLPTSMAYAEQEEFFKVMASSSAQQHFLRRSQVESQTLMNEDILQSLARPALQVIP